MSIPSPLERVASIATILFFVLLLSLAGCGSEDTGGKAEPPLSANCDDGIQNGDETGVDCGGSCPPCEGSTEPECESADQCESGICDLERQTCAAPSCDDGVQNGEETDKDCGGNCAPCADSLACAVAGDCESGVCDEGSKTCVLARCDDGIQNGDETDKDCGGGCAPCADNLACLEAGDCESGVCDEDSKTCAPPRCDDGVQNGDESDVDCGGACAPCSDTLACLVAADCESGVCDEDNKICVAAHCNDGVQNGDETDKDCGGSCAPCVDNLGCRADGDCESGVCDEDNKTCTPPSCDDGVQNGSESDVDCGGSCAPCEGGLSCQSGADCVSGLCDESTKLCLPSHCTDGDQNGDETDIDCGGSCGACTCDPNNPNAIILDDGEAENGYGWNKDRVTHGAYAMAFTPAAYPATISTACAAFITNAAVESFEFTLAVYAADGAGGAPGTLIDSKGFTAKPASISGVPATPPFQSFDLSDLNIRIESGDVYLSVEWNVAETPVGIFIAADESSDTSKVTGYQMSSEDPWGRIEHSNTKYRALLLRASMPPAP